MECSLQESCWLRIFYWRIQDKNHKIEVDDNKKEKKVMKEKITVHRHTHTCRTIICIYKNLLQHHQPTPFQSCSWCSGRIAVFCSCQEHNRAREQPLDSHPKLSSGGCLATGRAALLVPSFADTIHYRNWIRCSPVRWSKSNCSHV